MDFTPYLGLSRQTDECLSPATPPSPIVNDVTDKTIVYLDDIPELPLKRLQSAKVWEARDNARLLASEALNSDLRAFLGSSFQSVPFYKGAFGKDSCTQYFAPPSQTISMPYVMRYMNGGELIFRSIGLNLSDAVENQVIELYQVGNDTPLKTLTIAKINARSYNQTSLPQAWKIPMDGNTYELRATLPAGVKVADNLLACGGCGGMGALMGMISNCCAGRALGWMVTLGSDCNYDSLLFQLIENDRTKRVLAMMLGYWAGYVLCSKPQSGAIERDTVLSETDLKDAAMACNQGYLNRLNWLKVEIPKLGLSTDGTCFKPVISGNWSRSGVFSS